MENEIDRADSISVQHQFTETVACMQGIMCNLVNIAFSLQSMSEKLPNTCIPKDLEEKLTDIVDSLCEPADE